MAASLLALHPGDSHGYLKIPDEESPELINPTLYSDFATLVLKRINATPDSTSALVECLLTGSYTHVIASGYYINLEDLPKYWMRFADEFAWYAKINLRMRVRFEGIRRSTIIATVNSMLKVTEHYILLETDDQVTAAVA